MATISTAAQPHIHEMPPATMLVVRTTGDPKDVAQPAIAALFGAATAVGGPRGALRARWPNAATEARQRWMGIWGIPVDDHTTEAPETVPGEKVAVETWDYGTVAEIVHEGPYATESASVAVLHEHLESRGYHIVGPHEEEYLTMPGASVQRTVIRYPVAPVSSV